MSITDSRALDEAGERGGSGDDDGDDDGDGVMRWLDLATKTNRASWPDHRRYVAVDMAGSWAVYDRSLAYVVASYYREADAQRAANQM